jgi:hypothetical protein
LYARFHIAAVHLPENSSASSTPHYTVYLPTVVKKSKYQDYQKRVPKLIPSLAPYRAPDERIVRASSWVA